jgi:hypothetical protein
LMVDVHVDATSLVGIEALDLNGRKVFTYSMAMEAGVNHVNLRMTDVATGMYLLRISDGESVVVRRIVKE